MKKLLTVLLLTMLLVSCKEPTQIQDSEPVISVEVTNLTEGQVVEGFLTLGTVKSQGSIDVVPLQGKTVDEIYVQPGDHVAAGQVLYTLELETEDSALNQTESSLRSKQNTLSIQLNDATRKYQNIKALYEQGAVSKSQLDSAEAQVDLLQIRYDEAQTEYNNQFSSVQSEGLDKEVKAPMSGYLTEVSIRQGEVLSSQSIVKIVDDSLFNVSSQLTSEQLKQLDSVKSIDIYVNGDQNHVVSGGLDQVDFVQSSSAGTYRVELLMAPSESPIYDGDYVEVFFKTATRQVNQLPVSAIKILGQDIYAFYVEEGRAVRQNISIGTYTDNLVEVIDAMEHDWIVSNVDQLQDGVKVKISNEK